MKIGDEVIKARRWDKGYCKYGGSPKEVPLGTQGKVTDISGDKIGVRFSNGVVWTLDKTELRLVNKTPLEEAMHEAIIILNRGV